MRDIDGEYMTVNPMAVRQDVDVYTMNKRHVTILHSRAFGTVTYVAVGATLVGSINPTTHEGDAVRKGDEVGGAMRLRAERASAGGGPLIGGVSAASTAQHGYFAFGGSTILVLFEKGTRGVRRAAADAGVADATAAIRADRIVLDQDLVANSKQTIETLVRMGTSLGRAPSPQRA